MILFPEGGVSARQAHLLSCFGDNVTTYRVQGSFDDCQSIMKQTFNDLPFKQRHRLGAVNSVNWARILAQIVYYVYATLRVARAPEVTSYAASGRNQSSRLSPRAEPASATAELAFHLVTGL